jgi:cell division protein FtsZ
MVFVTAGMGGGTGTGGGPIVANIAKSIGALVVGIVTKPFTCEGKKRMAQAEAGIEEMKKQVDTLIAIPNQKLLAIVERNTPLQEAFDKANDVLYNATRGIAELITTPGLINVDFADVRTIMREMGDALMGSGVATGENRSIEAAHAAISSPLLEGVSISGALGILVNVSGGPTMSLIEVDEAVSVIHEAAGEEANVIMGAVIDEALGEEMMVTVIATGFNKRGIGSVRIAKPSMKIIERIPVGIEDIQKLDEPAYSRRGIDIPLNPFKQEEKNTGMKASDGIDTDKPAFLRKIMD